MVKAKVVRKGGNAGTNGRPSKPGNTTRVVKSAGPNKKAGNKVARAQPVNKSRSPAQPKLVLQDPPRNAKPAASPRANNNGNNQARNAPKPKANNKSSGRPNSANSRQASNQRTPQPSRNQQQQQQQQQQPALRALQQKLPAKARGGSVSELTLALQTANSIAINRSHPKQAEVVELLRTHEKGWIDDYKFTQVLRGLAF